MRKKLVLIIYWIIIVLIFILYLVIIGILLSLFFNMIGIPQDKYISVKKLITMIVAGFLAKVSMGQLMNFVYSKFKKYF
jgi:hypothetical protein